LQKDFNDTIITQVLPYVAFKLNIEDQLNYYHSNPEKPFCENYINPKLKLVIEKFSKSVNHTKLQHLKTSKIGLGTAAIGVGGHVLHGEVVVDKGPGEADKRQQQQQELAVGERAGRRHHAKTTEMGPDQRVTAQQQGGGEGQDQ
jgi:hypothetical protein